MPRPTLEQQFAAEMRQMERAGELRALRSFREGLRAEREALEMQRLRELMDDRRGLPTPMVRDPRNAPKAARRLDAGDLAGGVTIDGDAIKTKAARAMRSRVNKAALGYAKAVVGVAAKSATGGLLGNLDIPLQVADEVVRIATHPSDHFTMPAGWVQQTTCALTGAPTHVYAHASTTGPIAGAICIGGQALAANRLFRQGQDVPGTYNQAYQVREYLQSGVTRYYVGHAYYRNQATGVASRVRKPLTGFASPDPNLTRAMPSPFALGEPAMAPAPIAALEPWTMVADMGGAVPPRRYGKVRASHRRPPFKRERERKLMSKSKRFAVMLFGALDDISELSELVGAFYDALPAHIRKKYDQDGRGAIDGAGQYGIDGADWKAQALYKHWDKVDVIAAVENIVKNHIEDKLIGAMHKNLPRNMINAAGDGQMAVGQFINDMLEEYVRLPRWG